MNNHFNELKNIPHIHHRNRWARKKMISAMTVTVRVAPNIRER